MGKIALVTDSACDVSPQLQERYHLDIMSFSITVDGKSYVEREDFTADEYYAMLREAKGLPATAHITPFRFLEKFMAYDDQGTVDLILVTICSKGSATNDAAQVARTQFAEERPQSKMRIHIVDSYTYSMAYGEVLCQAGQMVMDGEAAETILEFLEDAFARREVVLAAYSLKFIKQSGRVSAAAAIAGEVLGVRPIITLIDGESKVVSKVRGIGKVLPATMEIVKKRIEPGTSYMVGITDMLDEQETREICTNVMGYPPKGFFKLGSAVSTNTGPDAVGIVFSGQKRAR